MAGWDDTIVALATAPGVAAIGVIRISGKNTFEVVNQLFRSKDLKALPSHTIVLGVLKDDEESIDEVLLSIFKGPKSYTGEDTIEISCHGSPYIQQQIIHACIKNGARLARAGEFTQRAFLNGKLDLTQAESVADLIASNTKAAQKAALHNVRGGFSNQLKDMREQLIKFAALMELELDFATEDVEFADRSTFYKLIEEIGAVVKGLMESFKLGNVIKNGVTVAIIGKPNAGKSTLLNCLLNEERAIVSEIAGTTRDTIEETLNINGVLFRLMDTAGIRVESEDVIENIGIERSIEKMHSADIVIYIFDVEATTEGEILQQQMLFEEKGINYFFVANKCDLEGTKKWNFDDFIRIEAKHKIGISALRNRLYDRTVAEVGMAEATIITNARHMQSLVKMSESITLIKDGMENKIPTDLLAIEIRTALFHLGEITGEVTNEDKLDYIFSKFCIGK